MAARAWPAGSGHAKERDLVHPGERDSTTTSGKLPCRFAHATAITGMSQRRRGCCRSLDEDQDRRGEQRDREQLGPERERRRGHGECAEHEQGRGARGAGDRRATRPRGRDRPRDPQRGEREPERQANERGPQDREAGPAGDLVDAGEEHLRAPLLVEPGRAGDGERPRVDRRDAVAGEDVGAGAELVGEVHRRHRHEERSERGQRDREERPQLPDRRPARASLVRDRVDAITTNGTGRSRCCRGHRAPEPLLDDHRAIISALFAPFSARPAR